MSAHIQEVLSFFLCIYVGFYSFISFNLSYNRFSLDKFYVYICKYILINKAMADMQYRY